MRTPLASIKGYATALLLEETDWDAETTTEFLETIADESDRLTRLIEDILESAAIEAGSLRIELEPILVPRIAKRVVDGIAIHSNQHQFVQMFPPHFPVVEADAHRIEQVLRNLLDNAVKYSPDGGLIVVRGEMLPGEVVVSVVDQGIGIAPEDLNKLFERFFRVSPDRRAVAGTGLGLPISDSIVRAHGGRIWAESAVGRGTTLAFTLPHPRVQR
jgi:signal transduction histidine kinase